MVLDVNKINRTKSLCEKCLGFVDAAITENEGKSYIEKTCPRCGKSTVKISNYSWFYSQLRDFYFKIFTSVPPQKRYFLLCTPNCNLQCPICYLRPYDNTNKAITAEEVEDILKRHKIELILHGGEPTCADNIFELIEVIKKYQKNIILTTNGLKLENYAYLLKLKSAGVNKVVLQFDGFDKHTYEVIRGRDIVQKKLKVLDNLKRANLPVSLTMTVLKGVNEDEVIKIFDYALKNDFIRGITFLPYTVAKKEKPFSQDKAILGDDIIDIIERDTQGKINRRDIFLFQKLLFVFLAYLNRRVCLHSQQYVLIRSKNGYIPIGRLLNLSRIEKVMDRYAEMKKKGKAVGGAVFLLLNLPRCILNPLLMKVLFKWIKITFQFAFRKKDHHLIDKDYLAIQVETCCAPPQMDHRVVSHCLTGWIFKDKSGKLYVKNNCSTLLKKVWME